MAAAQPVLVPDGDLGRLFYRKSRLIHVELPAAAEFGIDTKEVDDFRQEILEVMPPVTALDKEVDDAYAQGLQIAHIRLNHISGRLVRAASRVLLEKVKREIARDNQSAVRREDIQKYKNEILGVAFSQAATTSNEEQLQQFKTKIREAVATLKAKTLGQEIRKDKDQVEKRKALRFSDILNNNIMDEDEFEFDEVSMDITPNTSFSDSGIELAHDFDPFSTMDDKDKEAESYYEAVYVQDPLLPCMFDQDSSDGFNSTSNNWYTGDVYSTSTFHYGIDDSEFNDFGFLPPDHDPEDEAEDGEDKSHDGNTGNNNNTIFDS
ncbi:hypothetical protein DV736_g6209, partial [Chaetothyriales sp. CBS 134916]